MAAPADRRCARSQASGLNSSAAAVTPARREPWCRRRATRPSPAAPRGAGARLRQSASGMSSRARSNAPPTRAALAVKPRRSERQRQARRWHRAHQRSSPTRRELPVFGRNLRARSWLPVHSEDQLGRPSRPPTADPRPGTGRCRRSRSASTRSASNPADAQLRAATAAHSMARRSAPAWTARGLDIDNAAGRRLRLAPSPSATPGRSGEQIPPPSHLRHRHLCRSPIEG